jgi:probable rRNA maturation factor
LVDGRESRALNRRFRGKDKATDVLSFPSVEGRVPRAFSGYLGDLALCLPYAWRKRERFDPDFGGEAAFLLLHGLLHLHGQHHDTPTQEAAMWRLQRRWHPLWRAHAAALRRLAPTLKA